jgi:hypothetical protein
MALSTPNPKPRAGAVFKVILLIFIVGIAVRITTWENQYYKSEEGKERIAPRSAGDISTDSTDVDETVIPQEEVAAYTVAADKPRYLTIEKISVHNARILPVNIDIKGAMQVPRSIFDVGWYIKSAAPGTKGTSILDGHNGGPTMQGVFKNLNLLEKGDHITIEMGDGTKYTYQVYENITVPLTEANQKMSSLAVSPVSGIESISLITCTGEWSDLQKTYLSRQFLRAVRI